MALCACSQHRTAAPIVNTNQSANTRNTPTPLPSPTPQAEVTFGNGLRIVPKNMKLENEQWRYKIDVDYPQIEGTDYPAVSNLNRQIKELVTKKYRWALGRPTKEDLRYYAKWPGVFNSVDMEYDVVLATDRVLSIDLMAYHYGIGAAHSVHESFSVNYDFKSQRLLTLADLFKPGAKHLQIISQRCIDELSKKNPYTKTDPTVRDVLAPKTKNFNSWNLTTQGLRINFDACRVDSCAEGDITVEIPLVAFKSLLRADGPASRL